MQISNQEFSKIVRKLAELSGVLATLLRLEKVPKGKLLTIQEDLDNYIDELLDRKYEWY